MEAVFIKSNCLAQSVKRKIENPKGKIGVGFKENGRIYFFYELDGKRFRFGRKLLRYSNKNRVYFIGYNYIETDKHKERNKNDKTYILF